MCSADIHCVLPLATPGRLSDLQQNQLLNLKGVTYLVNISAVMSNEWVYEVVVIIRCWTRLIAC